MSEPNLPQRRFRAGDAERDRALTALQRAYEAGRLDLEEMHERQEQALRVVYTDELPALLGDLPEAGELVGLAPVPEPVAPPVLPGQVAELPGTVTIMSGKTIQVPAGTQLISDFAWWGGNVYDLTQAMGPGQVVTMNLTAIMAGHEIRVPRGVRVLDQAMAIMAGSDVDAAAQGDGSNGTLVIKGLLFWAGHSVKLSEGPQG